MPQFMFLLHDDEESWREPTDEQWRAEMRRHEEFEAAVQADGGRVLHSHALQGSATARNVRPQEGAPPVVTDGPVVQAQESLSGYYLVEAADIDQAVRLAALCPSACTEVRPVLDLSAWH